MLTHKKINKSEIINSRLTKEYNERLEALALRNKRKKADMIRLIIEKYLDMISETV